MINGREQDGEQVAVSPRSEKGRGWADSARGVLLILPNTAALAVFFLIPIGIGFGLAFYRWNIFKPAEFVGFENFRTLVDDERFWTSLFNTVQLVFVLVPIQIALATLVAVGLNQKLRAIGLLRTMYFLPVVTSTVAAAQVFVGLFQPEFGLANGVIGIVSEWQPRWLTDPDLILFPIGAVSLWQRLGFDVILILAGLQAIPSSANEVADVEGASAWQRLRYVTIPTIAPTLFLVAVLEVIWAFQTFDQVVIMTQGNVLGGVGGSASTLSFYVYQASFLQNKFGYAAAIALTQFALILVVTMVQFRGQRRWVHYANE